MAVVLTENYSRDRVIIRQKYHLFVHLERSRRALLRCARETIPRLVPRKTCRRAGSVARDVALTSESRHARSPRLESHFHRPRFATTNPSAGAYRARPIRDRPAPPDRERSTDVRPTYVTGQPVARERIYHGVIIISRSMWPAIARRCVMHTDSWPTARPPSAIESRNKAARFTHASHVVRRL